MMSEKEGEDAKSPAPSGADGDDDARKNGVGEAAGKDGAPADDKEGKKKDEPGPEQDKPKPSIFAKPSVRIAAVVAAVLVVAGLIWWYINYRAYGRYQQSTTDAYVAADQVSVAARVSGYVEQVFVTDNQLVGPGQVLVRIDSRTYAATAAQSRAQVAQALATVAQARAQRIQQYDQIRQSTAQADQSRATLRQNEVTARFNGDQVARYRPLSAVGAETDEKLAQNVATWNQSLAQVASARGQLNASDAQVASARHQIQIIDAQIRSGEAQVALARAQVAASMLDLDATKVASRIAGRVGSRTVRVGQYVPAATRMMSIVPVDRLYVTANFKETQIGLMRIGQPVTIEVDALPGDELHGEVESFSPGTGSRFALVPTDNATGNFTKIVQRVPVRIRVDVGSTASRVLVPGLSVKASVDTRGARDERDEQKSEGKHSEGVRSSERKHEVEHDRATPGPGPGR